MPWHIVKFDTNDILSNAQMNLQREFMAAFDAAGRPEGAMLLERRQPAMPFAVLFSPEASAIAGGVIARYKGEPCDEPDPNACAFLAGREVDRARFFGR